MTKKDKVEPIAWKLLEEAGAEGLKTGEAIKLIQSKTPWARNTIIWDWDRIIRENPSIIKKIGRGRDAIILLTKFIDKADEMKARSDNQDDSSKNKKPEISYYEPFAKFLEFKKICTDATSTEETQVRAQWHNPDVIGVKKFSNKHARAAIITAEIKSDPSEIEVMRGFGQSCAYKLFSHQVYLVVPKRKDTDQEDRMMAHCVKHNIGLVFFDLEKPQKNPGWEIKNIPASEEPNYTYVDSILGRHNKNSKVRKILKRYDII